MYIVDFFKNLFKKNNIGTIIWMVLNIVLICGIFTYVQINTAQSADAAEIAQGIITGLVIYLISILIALSPAGEAVMRFQNGCKKINDPDIAARIQPLFDEVYANAKKLNPELPDNITLYLSDDDSPNAFALGRHTVCVTKGLLSMDGNDIKGILGHEFGHLAHKDTDTLLVMSVGNLIVSVLFAVWRFLFNVFAKIMNFILGIMSRSVGAVVAGFITRIFIDFILVALMAIWTKLGVLICMASSRANEYLADKYSFELGYGNQLAIALQKLSGGSHSSNGVFAALSSSHPATSDRIERLRQLLRG
jgi:heat shock protein HtpX